MTPVSGINFGAVNFESDDESSPSPDVVKPALPASVITKQLLTSAALCAQHVPAPIKPLSKITADVQNPIWFFQGSIQEARDLLSQKGDGAFAVVKEGKDKYKVLFYEEAGDFPNIISSRDFTVEDWVINYDDELYATMNGKFEDSGMYNEGLLDILNLEASQGVNACPIFTKTPESLRSASTESDNDYDSDID